MLSQHREAQHGECEHLLSTSCVPGALNKLSHWDFTTVCRGNGFAAHFTAQETCTVRKGCSWEPHQAVWPQRCPIKRVGVHGIPTVPWAPWHRAGYKHPSLGTMGDFHEETGSNSKHLRLQTDTWKLNIKLLINKILQMGFRVPGQLLWHIFTHNITKKRNLEPKHLYKQCKHYISYLNTRPNSTHIITIEP